MKSLHMTVETQTEEEDIVSLIFFNQKNAALETSEIARIVKEKNINIFNKLNKRTQIRRGTIYRRELVSRRANTSRLGTNINNSGVYHEKLISRLVFDQNILEKQARLRTSAGNIIDFFPDSLKVFEGRTVLDHENLTEDDVASSTILTDAQQLFVNLGDGIKCFLINDYAVDRESLLDVSYRVIFEVDTFFENYINFVLKEIDDSIFFLQSMYNIIITARHYNSTSFRFNDQYLNELYESLGLDGVTNKTNLNNDRIKNSNFGKAGLSFYNGTLLLQSSISPTAYRDVLMSIIPNNKTNPDKINNQIKKFMSLRDNISKTYLINSKSSSTFSKVSSKKQTITKKIEAVCENYEIEKDKIGYNVFSENQKGINKMSPQSYINRFVGEQKKYYPKLENSPVNPSMSRKEVNDFRSTSKKASFLTPANLVYGDKKITTSRGVNNINSSEIKKFRIAKSQKSRKKRSSKLGLRSKSNPKFNENTMSSFNLTISAPKKGLIERSTNENIDPLVDSKFYLGERSFFITSNPKRISTMFKRINIKEDRKIFEIVSNIIPRRFLKNRKSLKSSREIRLSNKGSATRKLLVDNNIDFKSIPPQVKYMMSDSFYKNETSDPLVNVSVAPVIDETQKNLYVIKALTGFERDDDGIPNFKRPIYQEIDQTDMGSKVMIAKAYDHEVPELGIIKDTFMGTIYNNLLLLGI